MEGPGGPFCCPGNYLMINAIRLPASLRWTYRRHHACGGRRLSASPVRSLATRHGRPRLHQHHVDCQCAARYSPVLVLASNMAMFRERRSHRRHPADVSAAADHRGHKSYGKRITIPNRIHEYAQHAFRELKSGVPGWCTSTSRRSARRTLQGRPGVEGLLGCDELLH